MEAHVDLNQNLLISIYDILNDKEYLHSMYFEWKLNAIYLKNTCFFKRLITNYIPIDILYIKSISKEFSGIEFIMDKADRHPYIMKYVTCYHTSRP